MMVRVGPCKSNFNSMEKNKYQNSHDIPVRFLPYTALYICLILQFTFLRFNHVFNNLRI